MANAASTLAIKLLLVLLVLLLLDAVRLEVFIYLWSQSPLDLSCTFVTTSERLVCLALARVLPVMFVRWVYIWYPALAC